MNWAIPLLTALIAFAVGSGLLRWGMRWGSTPAERDRAMPGDDYLEGGPPGTVSMTRAISIDASPDQVWPWIAQLGRGAGWYSFDWLDNGRKTSAQHVVSWIPEPALGDATAIGYLRDIDPGRSLAWWVNGVPFAGAPARLVSSFIVDREGEGTRLVSRMSADASGFTAPLALFVFRVIDSIMARQQLLGIRRRADVGTESLAGFAAETGARDQYQLYEVIYAEGESAGRQGTEHAARWRETAIEDEVL